MNYRKIYDSLIQRAIKRELFEQYVERHHIIPRCMGGGDDESNIAALTAREHYVAHWLLVKMYPGMWKLYYAFFQMTKAHTHQRVVNSRDFERARKYMSDGAKIRYQLGLAPKKTVKGREILSEKMKGDNNPMRKWPEKNHTARSHTVFFANGTTKTYNYGKLGYEDLGIPRSTWIYAVRTKSPVPKYGIVRIEKSEG